MRVLGLFSVSYAGFWGQTALSTEQFVDKAAELGFSGILLMAKRPHLSPLDFGEQRLKELKSRIEGLGLQMIGLAAYNDFLLDGPAEVPLFEMQMQYIEESCRICALLGGEIVRVFTGYGGSLSDSSPHREWERVVRGLQETGDRAVAYGVKLAVQNHHDFAVDTSEMERLIEEIGHPAVKAGFDAWSPHLRGENLFDAAKRMAPYMVLSIAADYQRYARYRYRPELVNYERLKPDIVRAVSMNEGEVDYDSFLKGLSEGGYTGPLVYEMCSPLKGGGGEKNLDEKAAAFLGFIGRRENI